MTVWHSTPGIAGVQVKIIFVALCVGFVLLAVKDLSPVADAGLCDCSGKHDKGLVILHFDI